MTMKLTLKHTGEEVEYDGAKDLRTLADQFYERAKSFESDHGGEAMNDEAFAEFNGILEDTRTLVAEAAKHTEREDTMSGFRKEMEDFKGRNTGDSTPLKRVRVLHPDGTASDAPRSIGESFTRSEQYQSLLKSGALDSNIQRIKTEPVRTAEGVKAASDLIHTGTSGPAEDLVYDQILPGILGLPQRPLAIRDLFSQGETTSDTVVYSAQTAFDSGALAVAQATSTSTGSKPQSSIAWERRTRPVETLATWIATTRQALADVSQMTTLIDTQGRLMIQLEEEDQLISGNGSSPNLQGVLGEDGVQTLNLASTNADNLDGIRTARRLVATGLSRLQADSIVLNPVDSEEFDLLKDEDRNYRGGNPIGNFTFDQTIWRLRRVESEAITAGTALVGAFSAGATVLQRTPIEVYTSDSHSDFFTKNLVAILFEERLGFPIFFPSAFVKITLTDWEDGSGS